MRNFILSSLLTKSPESFIIVYGTIHALIDASCTVLMLHAINTGSELFFYILIYNLLAFGMQLPLGWLIDYFKKPVFACVTGCILLILSILNTNFPLTATLLAGFGNAIFHVGGGTIALNINPRKALMPGLFVAPGGIGLTIGILFARYKLFNPIVLITLLILACVIIFLIKSPEINYSPSRIKIFDSIKFIILLLLISIVIRSMIGFAINFPWKSSIYLYILLALSIAFGKAFGGLLADRFGWLNISFGSLIFSAFLLTFGANIPITGIIGIFLFNITMPVTLAATSNLLSGRPGFSFGLTTLALIIGALPTFYHYKKFIGLPHLVFILILLSTITLFIGLKLYNKFINHFTGQN